MIDPAAGSDTGTGFEVCTIAVDCQRAGSTAGLGGEMSGPGKLDTDSAGNVYVADSFSERIQKFASNGTWERA